VKEFDIFDRNAFDLLPASKTEIVTAAFAEGPDGNRYLTWTSTRATEACEFVVVGNTIAEAVQTDANNLCVVVMEQGAKRYWWSAR
jgi:hypothetical protein